MVAVTRSCVYVTVVALIFVQGMIVVACDRAGCDSDVCAGSEAKRSFERRTPMPDKMKRFTSWKVKYNTERIKATLDAMRPEPPLKSPRSELDFVRPHTILNSDGNRTRRPSAPR
jgi:hypothetical protein